MFREKKRNIETRKGNDGTLQKKKINKQENDIRKSEQTTD